MEDLIKKMYTNCDGLMKVKWDSNKSRLSQIRPSLSDLNYLDALALIKSIRSSRRIAKVTPKTEKKAAAAKKKSSGGVKRTKAIKNLKQITGLSPEDLERIVTEMKTK